MEGTVRAQRLCDASGGHCRTLADGWDPAVVVLEDAPVISVDANLGTVFEVTLGGHHTLGNPSGGVKGQGYTFWIRQDSTGGRDLAWGSKYLFSANSIPATAPNALSAATFSFDGTNFLNTGGYNLSGIVPFNFNNATGVGTSAVIVSNAITLSGISGAVLASITGPGSPALSVNNGPWTTTASVAAGDTLKVRATSSANVVTTTSELIVVGGYTTSWSITTTTNPSAFSYSDVLGAAWNTVVESGAAAPTGYTGALPVSVTGEGSPELSVDGGAWVAAGTVASIAPGQTLNLRLTSAGSAATTRSCALVMASFSTTWSVATTPNPGAFSFADISTGVAWNTVTTATPVTPVGHTGPLVVSVTGTGGPQISIDGGNWGDSGVITPGQTLSVRLTSADAPATARSAAVTVGSYQTTWTVTSSPNPGTFSFVDISTGVAWNTVTAATAVTPTGFNGPLRASVSGQGSPEISIAGGTWSSQEGIITPGQTLAVRLTSANAPATAYSAAVTVGSYQTTWTVTSTPNPTAFNFANVSGVSWNTTTPAAALTPTGYNGPLRVKIEGSVGSPEISVAGGTWTAAGTWLTISPTQGLNVRLTSAGASNTGRSATITMGSLTTTWTLTTTTDPTTFSFANDAAAVVNAETTAPAVTPTGYAAALPVYVTGAGTPKISVAGGDWTGVGTTLSISPTQTLAVRLTAPGTIGLYNEATVTLGGRSTTWRVTAGAYYAFTSHTFTTCGASGQSGPAQSSCVTAYSSTSWKDNASYFSVSGGIQQWKVPQTGTYRIEVWGARGGICGSYGYGWGARMRGDFPLTVDSVLKILVGQSGTDYSSSNRCGGGGGTFVTTSLNSALIIAGGGGGGYSSCGSGSNSPNATTSTTARTANSSPCPAASGGNGGQGWDAGGGGGLNTNGTATRQGSPTYGIAFVNGGAGGPVTGTGTNGGFGGGGGAHSGADAGGGGGGYSGGSGGYCASGYSTPNCGAGGGSYNSGSNQDNSNGESVASPPQHGKVTITKL